MPTFVYEALNEEGHVVRGLVEAESRNLALNRLKQYRFQIRNLQEQTWFTRLVSRLRRVSQVSVALFTRQLATMIKAGLPIMRCFDLLSRKGEDRRFEDVLLLVKESVKAGSSLSQALSRFPDVFNPVYIALVRAGEASGETGDILERMANYLEKDLQLKKRVRAAMTYPLIIFAVCVIISFGLILYIFPKFIELFEGFHLSLPFTTRVLIFLVNALKNPFVLVFLFGVAGTCFFLISQYVRTIIGRRHYHHWLLRMPVFGHINQKVAISRFCRTLATLFGSGVPILHSLEIVSNVTGNEIVNEAVDQAQEAVKYGSSISAPLEESGFFPPMVINMLQVGEQTGYLHKMLGKIADYYDLEVELSLIALTKLMEPALIGIMGLIVGFVVLSIFMPIYQLIATFGK